MTDNATVVLVHGAWSGSWIFGDVVEALKIRGVESVAVDLPSCIATDTSVDVHDDAAHVRAVLASIDGPVVLLGNSYGGAVITEAAVDQSNVKRLVYLAAAMPVPNESIMGALSRASAPDFMSGVQMLADGRAVLDVEVGVRNAFQQASPEFHDLWRSKASTGMSFGSDPNTSLPKVAWETIPSTYVVCSEDRAIKPEMQLEWAKERATDVVELPFDHCPQASHPDELAELLARLV